MSSPTAAAPASSAPPPLRDSLVAVTAAAVAELDPVWKLKPADIGAALMDVIPPLVDKWGLASASVAADWYDNLRESKAVAGRFTAIVPPLDNLGAEALAGWAAQPVNNPEAAVHALDEPVAAPKLGGLKFVDATAEQPGSLQFLDEQLGNIDAAQYRAEGGLQKRLVNAANLTVTTSAAQDPKARGWMRVTRPGACKFCVMVASKGGVFTKASSTFACHENCHCTSVPAWGGQPLPVGPYKPSDRPSTAADRVRVREWIAKNL